MNVCAAKGGCDRPVYAKGLCRAHWQRQNRNSTNTKPIGDPTVADGDDVFMPCPDGCLAQAAAIADIDARNIAAHLWKLAWHTGGFTPKAG